MRLIFVKKQISFTIKMEHSVLNLTTEESSLTLALLAFSSDYARCFAVNAVSPTARLKIIHFILGAGHDFYSIEIIEILRGEFAVSLLGHMRNEFIDDFCFVLCIYFRNK